MFQPTALVEQTENLLTCASFREELSQHGTTRFVRKRAMLTTLGGPRVDYSFPRVSRMTAYEHELAAAHAGKSSATKSLEASV